MSIIRRSYSQYNNIIMMMMIVNIFSFLLPFPTNTANTDLNKDRYLVMVGGGGRGGKEINPILPLLSILILCP